MEAAGGVDGAVHAAADIVRNSKRTEPTAVRRSCGWNILVAFRLLRLMGFSTCPLPADLGFPAGQLQGNRAPLPKRGRIKSSGCVTRRRPEGVSSLLST